MLTVIYKMEHRASNEGARESTQGAEGVCNPVGEAVALNFADNTDAKLQTFTEILENSSETGWMGFNRLFDSNLRNTSME